MQRMIDIPPFTQVRIPQPSLPPTRDLRRGGAKESGCIWIRNEIPAQVSVGLYHTSSDGSTTISERDEGAYYKFEEGIEGYPKRPVYKGFFKGGREIVVFWIDNLGVTKMMRRTIAGGVFSTAPNQFRILPNKIEARVIAIPNSKCGLPDEPPKKGGTRSRPRSVHHVSNSHPRRVYFH